MSPVEPKAHFWPNPECLDGDLVPDRLVIFAKDQPEYLQLPARVAPDGLVTTKWKLSWRERFDILFGKPLHLQILTFNMALQPTKMTVGDPY